MTGRRIALVLDENSADMGEFIAAAARGLQERGDRVAVLGPSAMSEFGATDATFVPVEIAGRVDPLGDVRAGWALRGALWASARGGPDVVHTFGRRAASIASASIVRRIPLVATWWTDLDGGHSANPGDKEGLARFDPRNARERAADLVKRVVARRASVCVCSDSDQVTEALSLGARDARVQPSLTGHVGLIDDAQQSRELADTFDALYRELTGT